MEMDTQYRVQAFTQRKKFAEPRGWALKWVFTQEAAGSATGQVPEDDNGTWEKFAEPRGWALKWDGFALSDVKEQQSGHVLSPAVESR